MQRLGFIGLGNMGGHMARNLLSRGVQLVVYDVDKSKLETLQSQNASSSSLKVAENPAEVAANCNEIVTMLPNSAHVRSVFMDKFGILDTLKAGSLCLDCSTIDQSVSIFMAECVADRGCTFVDAPVSGGVLGAKDGTLTFMVGGNEDAFNRARPILALMGKNTVHCGKVGSGQATKICNNMLLSVQMIALAEALNLGVKMGLDPKMLTSVINSSSGRCWSSDTYNPCPGVLPNTPASSNYNGGFGCKLMAKDLGLAQNSSTQFKPKFADKDFTVVYKMFEGTDQQMA
uniref:3-hydroxyisobutyrate dehydrogenase n=1 Tax=Globodera rostochiensis TaxID=31243 RepID=A0A914HBE3_GLORO